MKIVKRTHKKNTKALFIVVAITVLVAILLTVYIVGFRGSILGWSPFTQSSINDDATVYPSDDVENDKAEKGNSGSSQTTNQIPISPSLNIQIENLIQSDGYITFVGDTNDTSSLGKCSIIFTNPNDRPVVRNVEATKQAGSAACGPIKIPETEFSYIGGWHATFRYYSNNEQAVSEQEIVIK